MKDIYTCVYLEFNFSAYEMWCTGVRLELGKRNKVHNYENKSKEETFNNVVIKILKLQYKISEVFFFF